MIQWSIIVSIIYLPYPDDGSEQVTYEDELQEPADYKDCPYAYCFEEFAFYQLSKSRDEEWKQCRNTVFLIVAHDWYSLFLDFNMFN